MTSNLLDRIGSRVIHLVTTAHLDLSREEWVYFYFGIVLFGFLAMRGFGHRG